MKYSLRSLMIVVTLVGVFLGGACGLWRFGRYIFVTVEREHWTKQVREGRERDPHNSPAKYFLTAEQIDALDEEARLAGKKKSIKRPNSSAPAPSPPKQ